jgi:hypothetical protein
MLKAEICSFFVRNIKTEFGTIGKSGKKGITPDLSARRRTASHLLHVRVPYGIASPPCPSSAPQAPFRLFRLAYPPPLVQASPPSPSSTGEGAAEAVSDDSGSHRYALRRSKRERPWSQALEVGVVLSRTQPAQPGGGGKPATRRRSS